MHFYFRILEKRLLYDASLFKNDDIDLHNEFEFQNNEFISSDLLNDYYDFLYYTNKETMAVMIGYAYYYSYYENRIRSKKGAEAGDFFSRFIEASTHAAVSYAQVSISANLYTLFKFIESEYDNFFLNSIFEENQIIIDTERKCDHNLFNSYIERSISSPSFVFIKISTLDNHFKKNIPFSPYSPYSRFIFTKKTCS